MIATSNTMIAKVFAVLAVAGLVVSSVAAFAPVAGAQTTTTTTSSGSVTTPITFTNDLTIGSTGAAVTALQTFLIAKGFSIPAGATGYFGAQTQAALASYQAANGIAPAAGYFGPITRAHVNAAGPSTGGTGTGTGTGSSDNDGDLSGGEADLNDFDLVREDSSGDEGEEMVEIATAEFDVDDADARIERAEITFDASNGALEDRPWQYFDTIYVMVDGDEVADVDASDRDEWDETSDDVYVLTISGLDFVVEEGDMASMTFAADIADSIDTDDQAQTFSVYVDDEGIRAVDGEGIQQYIGDDSDTVSFGFGAEDNGDLSIKSSSEDPDSSILVADADDESEDYTVFIFDIENDGDADSLITDMTFNVATTGGALSSMVRSATLVIDGDEFDGDITSLTGEIAFEDIDMEIGADEELEVELMVTLTANATAGTLDFSIDSADVDAEGLDSGDDADVGGSASSATHTVALTGVAVEAVSTSETVTTPGDSASSTYGTYTIKFDVTALEEDAIISNVVGTSTTNGIEYDIFGLTAGGAAYTGTASAILTSTADTTATTSRFIVEEGATETFTLTVTLDPAAAGTFGVELEEVNFNDQDLAGNTVFTVDSSNEDFRTDPVYLAD
ncbi:MAG TPA: peptidoglycan-binding protein [Candidatus Paceibacterota bacterium]|nr:peptidoglycan-binding protein [Candidatus Paceibacterota bacterium]